MLTLSQIEPHTQFFMPKKKVGVTRETADRLLDNLLTRAKEIDADPQYLYGISRLAVFGSYLTAKDKLGDIDIAVELGPKERVPERHWEACAEQRKNGPRGQSFIEYLLAGTSGHPGVTGAPFLF